tara:strand:- start:1535 stop:2014 length:480 start_codon:yes stop_codon:yes gene_type:complete
MKFKLRETISFIAFLSLVPLYKPALSSKLFEPRVKDLDKYEALCASGGGFDGCSVFIDNQSINAISIDGAKELNLCHEKAKIGYRSNPSSPYKRIGFENTNLESIALQERGIDHDFLVSVPKTNSVRRKNLVVRFKNHKVAVDFAGIMDLVLSTCPPSG